MPSDPTVVGPEAIRRAVRLIVITDDALAAPRSSEQVVEAALEGGARMIQLRDKGATARRLLARARALRDLVHPKGGMLIVNDRLDVALAAGADGVHLGPDDLPVAAARRVAPPGFVIGYSTDDPVEARRAEREGADYLGCGAVYATASKADAGDVIGPGRLDEVAGAVGVPVVGIGGITPARAAEIAASTRAAGVAVIAAVMDAPDPLVATRALLAPFARG